MQNVFDAPVAVTSIDVLDGAGTSLATFDRGQIAAMTGPIISGTPPTTEVAPNAAVATAMDVVLPTSEVPDRITHRITYETGESATSSILGGADILGPDLEVDPRVPLTIGAPLRGTGWLNASSCCAPESLHRNIRLAVGGTSIKNVQEFAVDWSRLRDGAIAAGTAAATRTITPTAPTSSRWPTGPSRPRSTALRSQTPDTPRVGIDSPTDYAGNHVSIQVAPDVWAVYAHIQPGTITVQPGDKVTKGQVIGKLGNSGNSGGPHLHFQLADGPELLNSSSLPFVLESYELLGTVDPATVTEDDPEIKVSGPAGPQRNTYPLTYTVIDLEALTCGTVPAQLGGECIGGLDQDAGPFGDLGIGQCVPDLQRHHHHLPVMMVVHRGRDDADVGRISRVGRSRPRCAGTPVHRYRRPIRPAARVIRRAGCWTCPPSVRTAAARPGVNRSTR